jgi:hypothetical protein
VEDSSKNQFEILKLLSILSKTELNSDDYEEQVRAIPCLSGVKAWGRVGKT